MQKILDVIALIPGLLSGNSRRVLIDTTKKTWEKMTKLEVALSSFILSIFIVMAFIMFPLDGSFADEPEKVTSNTINIEQININGNKNKMDTNIIHK